MKIRKLKKHSKGFGCTYNVISLPPTQPCYSPEYSTEQYVAEHKDRIITAAQRIFDTTAIEHTADTALKALSDVLSMREAPLVLLMPGRPDDEGRKRNIAEQMRDLIQRCAEFHGYGTRTSKLSYALSDVYERPMRGVKINALTDSPSWNEIVTCHGDKISQLHDKQTKEHEIKEGIDGALIRMHHRDFIAANTATHNHLGTDLLARQREQEFMALSDAEKLEMATTRNYGIYGIFHLATRPEVPRALVVVGLELSPEFAKNSGNSRLLEELRDPAHAAAVTARFPEITQQRIYAALQAAQG